MTEAVRQQLEAIHQAILDEPLVVGYDAANHKGVLSVARLKSDGDVEYVVVAEIRLLQDGPPGYQ